MTDLRRFSAEQCLDLAVKASALLFVLCIVFERFIGSGWRYLYWTALPASLIYLWFKRKNSNQLGQIKNSFKEFFIPFAPVVVGILSIYLFHDVGRSSLGFNAMGIVRVVFISSLIYACLRTMPNIAPKVFFTATSLMSYYSLLDLYQLSVIYECTMFDVRYFVDPHMTQYGRILSLTGGLSFLGAFYCKDLDRRWRAFFCISGLIGLVIPVFFLYVRAVVMTGAIALFCALLLVHKKIKWKLLLPAVVIVLAMSVFVGPIKNRFSEAFTQTIAVVQNDAAGKVLDAVEEGKEPDQKMRQLLLNNIGTRIAMWEMAWSEFKSSPVVGTGIGSPSKRFDLRTIFKGASHYYGLKHYHSDYLLALATGGLIFFLGLVLTELLLLKKALKDPVCLFLLLSIVSYSIIDIGFLLQSSFTTFIGAWVVLMTWQSHKKAQ